MPPTEETVVSVLALAYHSDDNTYGNSLGIFGGTATCRSSPSCRRRQIRPGKPCRNNHQ